MLGSFQSDCRRIKQLGDYTEFFTWVQLDDLLAKKDVHTLLCEAVAESTQRGYNVGGGKGGKRGKGGGWKGRR